MGFSLIAGLCAIAQQVYTMGISLIAGLRAIAQSDCGTARNRAVSLVSEVSLRWD